MKRLTRKVAVAPLIYEKIEVFAKGGADGDFGGEDVRGADGQPVYPGIVVRRRETYSDLMGVLVGSAVGRVQLLYRQAGRERVVVQTENGHFFWADEVVRSAAKAEEL